MFIVKGVTVNGIIYKEFALTKEYSAKQYFQDSLDKMLLDRISGNLEIMDTAKNEIVGTFSNQEGS